MKRPQELLGVKKSVSRMLDTLALEIVITDIDSNCEGLLDILQWREQNTISYEEFSQLYCIWISDRGIINQLETKQSGAFDKLQLMNLLGSTYLKGQKVRHFLDLLRKQYINGVVKIGILSQGITERISLIEAIFNQLDFQEVGSLRRSHLLTVVEGLVSSKILQLRHPNAEQVLREVENVEVNMNGVGGVISFRNFTKGLLKYQPTLSQLKSFLKCMNNLKNFRQPMNVFDCAISKCRTLPAFKKQRQLDIIRLFQEHQSLFTQSASDSYGIESKLQRIYGSQFLVMKDVDFIVIQQLLEAVRKQIQNKVNIMLKNYNSNPRNRQSMQRELSPRNISGMKTKYSNKTQPNFVSKTPRRLLSTINTTPKKQLMSPFGGGNTNQMRTYRHTSKSVSKKYSNEQEKVVRVKSKSPMNKMKSPKVNAQEFMSYHHFFKNRRVQSFDVVMKRLKMMRK